MSQNTHQDLPHSLSLCLLVTHRHTVLLGVIRTKITVSPRFLSFSYSPSYLRAALVKASYLFSGSFEKLYDIVVKLLKVLLIFFVTLFLFV